MTESTRDENKMKEIFKRKRMERLRKKERTDWEGYLIRIPRMSALDAMQLKVDPFCRFLNKKTFLDSFHSGLKAFVFSFDKKFQVFPNGSRSVANSTLCQQLTEGNYLTGSDDWPKPLRPGFDTIWYSATTALRKISRPPNSILLQCKCLTFYWYQLS